MHKNGIIINHKAIMQFSSFLDVLAELAECFHSLRGGGGQVEHNIMIFIELSNIIFFLKMK